MKAKTIISLAFFLSGALALGSSLAHASEVTGNLSSAGSSAPAAGSQVGGTFGGGSASGASTGGGSSGGGSGGGGSSGSLTGSVTGGSSTSGGGTGGGSVLGASTVNGGGVGEGATAGSVLGAFTSIPNSSLAVADDSSGSQDDLVLADTRVAVPQGGDSLTAAAVQSGFQMSWWFWLMLLLLLAVFGIYAYRRSRKEHQ